MDVLAAGDCEEGDRADDRDEDDDDQHDRPHLNRPGPDENRHRYGFLRESGV